MQCKIDWDGLSLAEWEARFTAIRRSALLQCYDYARAVCPLLGQKARWGLIRIDGAEAGLVQVMEAGFCRNLLHAIMLDRGPLWFAGRGGPQDVAAFFTEFNRQFPARPGRRRRIIPESAALDCPGFRRRPGPGYQTSWLDLTDNMEKIKDGLEKNWRGALRKAERSGLEVRWDETGATLSGFLANYQADKSAKGYEGASPALLRSLAECFAPRGLMQIGYVDTVLEKAPIAAILLLCHGTSATYQAGWSTDAGRKAAAHNLLLWQAVCHLKDKGVKDFDLGGINDDTAQGVRNFKQGMGGEKVVYAGSYY